MGPSDTPWSCTPAQAWRGVGLLPEPPPAILITRRIHFRGLYLPVGKGPPSQSRALTGHGQQSPPGRLSRPSPCPWGAGSSSQKDTSPSYVVFYDDVQSKHWGTRHRWEVFVCVCVCVYVHMCTCACRENKTACASKTDPWGRVPHLL